MRDSTLQFSSEAFYEIRVAGEAAHLGVTTGIDSVTLFRDVNERGDVETVLTARVKDQCALSGFLNFLYENFYVVLSVKRLPNERDPNDQG